MVIQKNRRRDIDLLKGIAIISIILYHIGFLPFGYLGVDMFLVLSGFLIIPPIIKNLSENQFFYFKWLWKRLLRFLPIVVIGCGVSMLAGFFLMMPDDYENLAASSFASEIFCNNILQAITTGNYWDSSSEYKPLLAFWYLGLVFQFFVLFPLIFITINKLIKRKSVSDSYKLQKKILYILTIISFILYLLPIFSFNHKFYYLPFRLWEFCIGGVICFFAEKRNQIQKFKYIPYALIFFIILILILDFQPLSKLNKITIIGAVTTEENIKVAKEFLLIGIVVLTTINLLFEIKISRIWGVVSLIGKMSLSFFIWHQIILAFLRYTNEDIYKVSIITVYLISVIIVGIVSYYSIEKIKIKTPIGVIGIVSGWLIVLIYSFYIYSRGGVVRDVPEMGVYVNNPLAIRNTEYIDKIYKLDKPFQTDKTKVLIIGNSFARDFACCLLEWPGSANLEISYMFEPTGNDSRYSQSDYIFFFGHKDEVPEVIWKNAKNISNIYGIGTKSFGKSFGPVYFQRNSPSYFTSSIPVSQLLKETNDKLKSEWGDNYIDFVEASLNNKKEIKLFTPDKMIISFDCRHLSPAGAQFFANQFDFKKIFQINK